jgi:glycerol uptake facilitator protein
MNEVTAEFIGTAILILLGNGVVANVVLRDTKGNNGGWIMISAGWGAAVATAVMLVGEISGAHLNPAVTIGLAAAGEFAWGEAGGYILAQMLGAMVGAAAVYVFYKPHFDITEDPDLKLATFCTAPQIRQVTNNLIGEALGTFVLVYAALMITDPAFVGAESTGEVKVGLGSIGAIRIGLVVFTIGLCLGGTTGYAINPARDLGPRIVHQLLPINDKRDSDWSYAAIPVVGPILGGLMAAALYQLCVYIESLT